MPNDVIRAEPGRLPSCELTAPALAEEQTTPRHVRPAASPVLVPQRLQSLDAYRGLIMITLAFVGFGLAVTATNHLTANGPSPFWEAVHSQFEHAEWVGCGYWDLIQPSFMFMVGAAMAFSYARRRQLGQSYPRMLGHAMWRSVVLVFLGIFLISNGPRVLATDWSFMNVLSQIGLGYTFLFLLWGRSVRTQASAAVLILAGTWLAYVLYPHAGIDLARGAPEVGVSAAWAQHYLADIPAAWHKNANVGHALDLWLVNLLPVAEPFRFNRGGYQTLNFLPSLATMLFGLMCGELLRTMRPPRRKLAILVAAGLAGLVVGQVLNLTGVCPLVKRIWTPSWALFSTGWCCLIVAGLYAVVDVLGYRRWAFPLIVVGLNSIAIYCMSMTLKPWASKTLKTHFGKDVFLAWGALDPLYEPMLQCTLVGLLFWLACWWMYRQKIFIRI
jgi:heparan-alpha-glucosaminide N-acetyltransferase